MRRRHVGRIHDRSDHRLDRQPGSAARSARFNRRNFSFSWTPGARVLFAELAPERFGQLGHNPTALLVRAHRRRPRPRPDVRVRRAPRPRPGRLSVERERRTWWQERGCPTTSSSRTSRAEFGLDESLPVYSGGLGILAGDHLKSAHELGVPLVGVGLFYRRRLLPPAARRGRPAGRALPAERHRAGCR